MRASGRLGFVTGAGEIRNDILVPRYYDPQIDDRLEELRPTHDLWTLADLEERGWLQFRHGKYIPKALYGTGSVPYVRTSDIANWELKGSPKHGIDEAIYNQLAADQDVRVNDILYVHEGTYLIGTPCLVTRYDTKILYQHHLAKLRVLGEAPLTAPLLLAALLAPVVMAQVRARQFTADVIDSIVGRLPEVIVPIPKDETFREKLAERSARIFTDRAASRVRLAIVSRELDGALKEGSHTISGVEDRARAEGLDAVVGFLGRRDRATTFVSSNDSLLNDILVPHYYDPSIASDLESFNATCELRSVEDLVGSGLLSLRTGAEVGKLAYGSGEIPFVRTSDLGNWELKHDPKQRVSQEVFDLVAKSASAQPGDILLVRDGTYLVGTSVLVSDDDLPMIFSGGIYRLRSLDPERLPAALLLALLNTNIVRRQMRAKQFTRDVIDTLGHRFLEVVLPLPRSIEMRSWIADMFGHEIGTRALLRREATRLGTQLEELATPATAVS